MNIQQRVQDILNRFDVNLTVTEEKSTELAEVTLENGTVVYTDDEFVVGAEAYIINDEGERISVPAGDYELNDGRLLVIGEGGAIEEIKGAEEPAEEPVAEEAEAERVEQSADEPEATEEVTEEATEELEVEVELEDEDEEKMYVTRDEVEEMIRAAFEALKEDDKEEMSDVNPEAPKAEAEAEAEEAPEADPVAEELAAVKAELSEMKDEAVPMLKHATPTAQAEPLDLSKLSLQERVAALHSKFSSK
jgi:6-pyruvoyl-tetrahydropterin synthase